MSLNIFYVSANGTANANGSYDNPMSLSAAVRAGGENSVIVLLNDAGVIHSEGVALYHNQFLVGAGATVEAVHSDGVTKEIFTAPGSGGAIINGTSKYNAVIGTHPDNETSVIAGVSATGGVNNAGTIAETRYQFVLSGQSNMAGWEDVKDFDKELQQVQENVKIWTGSTFASLTPDVNTNPLEYGAAPRKTWAGPELSLGSNLTQALGTDVYFTKVTAGGTSIKRWISGDMLDKVFSNTLLASKAIADSGYAPFIGGIGWTQGEADYGSRTAEYDQKLLTLLSMMQSGFGMPDLKMIVSGTSPYAGGAAIEEEQQQAASQSEFIETFSMQHFRAYSNMTVHFDAEGYSYMGYQFAVKFLEDLMGNPVAQEDITGYIPLWLRPVAPIAEDDYLTFIPGISETIGNVLDNDSDFNPETFAVTAVANQREAVGKWVTLAEGGRVKVMADGSYIFDDMQAWNNLGFGESVEITLPYTITDESGLSSEANLTITIIGKGQNGDFSVIEGDARNNMLMGTTGNDVIYGHQGNDVIRGNGGNDIIFAGAGNDVIYSDPKMARGDASARYVVFAQEGNDDVYGSVGDDIVDLGEGNNKSETYGGNDRITSGSGNDRIYAYSSNRRDDVGFSKVIQSGDGNDTISTSDSDDTIITGNGNDVINAGGGTDYIKTGDGNKRINAYASNKNYDAGLIKTIITGNGLDTITTSYSDDKIMTGDGNKTIKTYGGNDTIITGDGNNSIDTAGNTSARGQGRDNTVKIITGSGNDNIRTSASNDIIDAGDGDNTIYSYGGNDTISVGNGKNYINTGLNSSSGEGDKVTVKTGSGNASVYTSRSDDLIMTGEGNDTIYSYGGNDVIYSGAGNDRIYAYDSQRKYDQGKVKFIDAGEGNDIIYGSWGKDTIVGGAGDDRIYLYSGADIIMLGADDGKDIIAGFDVKEDKISFTDSGVTADDISMKASGSSTIIYYNSSSVTLQNVNLSKITEDLIVYSLA